MRPARQPGSRSTRPRLELEAEAAQARQAIQASAGDLADQVVRAVLPHGRRGFPLRDSSKQARLFTGLFRIAFLAVLLAGAAVAPYRLVAQESASAANTEAADSREAQEKAFLVEGPLVKASAKVLHLSVETTAIIYEFINFAILALAHRHSSVSLAAPTPAPARREGAHRYRVGAQGYRGRQLPAERGGGQTVRASDEEIEKFKTEVEREMGQDEARIKSALAEESARMVVAAEQEIAMAAAQARRGLRNFAADLAIGQAAKQMALTPETDRALIAEFVGDVTKGRQN